MTFDLEIDRLLIPSADYLRPHFLEKSYFGRGKERLSVGDIKYSIKNKMDNLFALLALFQSK